MSHDKEQHVFGFLLIEYVVEYEHNFFNIIFLNTHFFLSKQHKLVHLRVSLPTENVIQMLVFLYLNGLPHEPPFRLTPSESDLILSFLGGHVPAEFLFIFKLHTTPLSCHCRTCVIPLQSVHPLASAQPQPYSAFLPYPPHPHAC